MESMLKAVELTGFVDEHRKLQIEGEVPIQGPRRVRVILLYPEEDDIDEREWLAAGARNPAFSFLKEEREDIYTVNDGQPFDDEV